MAVGYRLIGKNRLIPRKTFKGRHRTFKRIENSPFANKGVELEIEEFDVLECVMQPLTGRAAKDYSSQINPEVADSTKRTQFTLLCVYVTQMKGNINLRIRFSCPTCTES